MIKTNKEKLVMQSVVGSVHSPTVRGSDVRITTDGKPKYLPTVGGICYNVKIGDSVYGLAGDHIEPGVSLQNPDAAENAALNFLSCVGNEARVFGGEAKGHLGVVTGTHGGIEHTLIYFPQKTLDLLCPGDKILVRAFGQGLVLTDHPDITVKNCDPRLLEAMGIVEQNGKLRVPVVATVPAYLMGSGIGNGSANSGDYDIMTADKRAVKKFGLEKLRFGDLVLLQDCDNTFGRGYLKGAVSVGVVVHSDCIITGHGPGVTTLLTCKTGKILPEISEKANIGNYLELV